MEGLTNKRKYLNLKHENELEILHSQQRYVLDQQVDEIHLP
jgi:hypothetical protein